MGRDQEYENHHYCAPKEPQHILRIEGDEHQTHVPDKAAPRQSKERLPLGGQLEARVVAHAEDRQGSRYAENQTQDEH